MMLVNFKALIPKEVENWIIEKSGAEDNLSEARIRLFRKLSAANKNSYFSQYGVVYDIEVKDNSWIGDCAVRFDVNNEEEARIEFKKLFNDIAKSGQKFKFVSFKEVDDE